MPKLYINQAAHHAEVQATTAKPIGTVTTDVGRTSIGSSRDLLEAQRHTLESLGRLAQMPFALGRLFTDIPLPGIRGRVRSFSGKALTLWSPADARNFVRYDNPYAAQRGGYVEASSGDSTYSAPRTGTQALTAIDPVNGVLYSDVNWSTTIPALANGDFLFGSKECDPPQPRVDSSGVMTGEWSGNRVVRIMVGGSGARDGMHQAGGVLVLRNAGSQPAELWLLTSAPGLLILGSKYASPGVDLWVF